MHMTEKNIFLNKHVDFEIFIAYTYPEKQVAVITLEPPESCDEW